VRSRAARSRRDLTARDRIAGMEAAPETVQEPAMKTLALVVALATLGNVAGAAPRPRGERGITIASAGDASPGVLDALTRRHHAEIVRRALLDVLHRSGADVRHAGVGPRQLDVAIVGWRVTSTATTTDVTAELKVVLCDDHGKILSIVTGRARVSGPRDPSRLAELREQALTGAVGGMTHTLHSQLDRAVS